MELAELLRAPVQPATKLVTVGYLAEKAAALAATTRNPPAGMEGVAAGMVKFTTLVNCHPLTFTATAPVLQSSMYSSDSNSEAGWYMISLITTSDRAGMAKTSVAEANAGKKEASFMYQGFNK